MTEQMNGSKLSGQLALVTGGGNGIGRACAHALAALGAEVAVLDLGCDPTGAGPSEQAATGVAEEIRAEGGRAIGIFADVADERSVATALEDLRKRSGPPQIAVMAAAIMRNRMSFNMTEAEWSGVVDVHLFGTLHVLRGVLPAMVERDYGRIVTFTSIAGLFGVTGAASYAAAKAAIEALTRTVADEYRDRDITVNAISPGARTRLGESASATERGAAGQQLAMGPLQQRTGLPQPKERGEPHHVARTVAALCLPECRLTGACVHTTGNMVSIVPPWQRHQVIAAVGPGGLDLEHWAGALR